MTDEQLDEILSARTAGLDHQMLVVFENQHGQRFDDAFGRAGQRGQEVQEDQSYLVALILWVEIRTEGPEEILQQLSDETDYLLAQPFVERVRREFRQVEQRLGHL